MKQHVFNYDLDANMQPTVGELIFDESGKITCGDRNYNADAVEEALVKSGVGCGALYLKMRDGSEVVLCRFTNSGLKLAGVFCNVVNYRVKNGIAIIPDEVEKRVCEKCGRPYVEGMNQCLFCYSRMNVMGKALAFLKPYIKKLTITQAVMLISSLLFLVTPFLNRFLIDNHLRNPIGSTARDIIILGLAMLAARFVGQLIFVFTSRIFNKTAILFTNDLRVKTYEKIQTLSMSGIAKRTPGDMIRRVMHDTAVIRGFVSDWGRWAIEMFIMFIVVLIILLFTNWQLTLLAFLPVPIVAVMMAKFWRFISIRMERQWRKGSKSQSILHDIIKGIRTVKAFGTEKKEIDKFADVSRELAEVSEDNEILWAKLFPMLTFLTGAGEFLILFFGARMVLDPANNMTLGMLVQFTMFMGFIYAPLRWLVGFPRWLADCLTSMVKVFEIMDEESELKETAEPNNVPVAGRLAFEDVSFGYKSYEPVLKDVSITIEPGEMIGLVGKSGVGKSTLINLVMRLYDPNTGRITVNGTDLRDFSQEYLHQNIGVVFQDNFLFAGTIFENIAYAKPDATLAEVIAAAKTANAHDFIMETPDGYNTMVGESGHSLSGGERQRISIARAIIKNPGILILDEATSALDVETESIIQDSLDKIIKGRTTIAIAHRLSTLRNASRLVVLEKGKVAEVGTHVELLKKKGIYYNLIMAQRSRTKTMEE
ncbi:MAG: ABC transporter ATP-binding protein/permease [Defluviitaleaceae bacterium]|nr:ABC transporter ATP-binding protein/permease [Defluviitaleaceae bacterium]